MILDSNPDSEKWVVQRRVYQRGNKCSWKTVSQPADFSSAMLILNPLPIDTSRLFSGIKEFLIVDSIQREEV